MLCLARFWPHPRKDVGAWLVSAFLESLLYLYEQLNIISVIAPFQSRVYAMCIPIPNWVLNCALQGSGRIPEKMLEPRRVPLSQSGFTQWRDDGRLESHQSSDAAVFSSPSSYHHKVIANYFHQKVMSATIFTNLSSHQWTYWSYHHPLKLHVLNLSTSHQLKMRQLLKRDSIRVLNKSKKWCCKPKITTRNTISQNSK